MELDFNKQFIVSFYKGEIPIIKELPNSTLNDYVDMAKLTSEILKNKKYTSILLDLSEATRPNAEMRECIKQHFVPAIKDIEQLAVVTGKNTILNIAVLFIMRSVTSVPFKVFKTERNALKYLKNE